MSNPQNPRTLIRSRQCLASTRSDPLTHAQPEERQPHPCSPEQPIKEYAKQENAAATTASPRATHEYRIRITATSSEPRRTGRATEDVRNHCKPPTNPPRPPKNRWDPAHPGLPHGNKRVPHTARCDIVGTTKYNRTCQKPSKPLNNLKHTQTSPRTPEHPQAH